MLTSMKEKILDNAMAAVGEREFTHGECVSNNKNIAELWSAYLSVPITADEVAIMDRNTFDPALYKFTFKDSLYIPEAYNQ